MSTLLPLQFRNLDRTTIAALADDLQVRAEAVPMCLGKKDPQWIACGTDNAAGVYVVCPNCKKHGTLMAIVSDLRIAWDKSEPGYRR